MEGPLKELAKLEKLTALSGKTPSISDSLDALLLSLQTAKKHVADFDIDEDTMRLLAHTVEVKKKEVDERQKEVYSSVSRLGKALDKVSTITLGVSQYTDDLTPRNSPLLCPHILTFSIPRNQCLL